MAEVKEDPDIFKAIADGTACNGQSTAEYVSAIFKVCGIEDDPITRNWLTALVNLLKRRVAENVKAQADARIAISRVDRFLSMK